MYLLEATHNGGTSGAPLKPLRVDSALRRGQRGLKPRSREGDPSHVLSEVNSVNDAAVTLFDGLFLRNYRR